MKVKGLAGIFVAAALAAAAAPPAASAACRASANNAHSFDTRLTPVPGQVCRMTVDVFAGGSCGQPARWQDQTPGRPRRPGLRQPRW